MKINAAVLSILDQCIVNENFLYLPNIQLDRITYEAVDKVLKLMGGKWNRKLRCHVFDHDISEEFESVLLTGEVSNHKKDFQFFPTPKPLAEYLCDLAEINSESIVLEPSCGKGNIADAVWKRSPNTLIGIDLDTTLADSLKDKPYKITLGVNFLAYDPESKFNRIVMNPPFSKHQDIDHIYKAYQVLVPGGIMVSVVCENAFWNSDKKSDMFRHWLNNVNASVEKTNDGAFKESGTMVRTRIIKIRKA